MKPLKLDSIFADRDFDDMLYPVLKIDKTTNLLGKYPDLQKLESWKAFYDERYDKNLVMRYIILCYDRQSPIFKKYIEDEGKRKSTAAMYAGWVSNEEGYFDDDVMEIFACRIQGVNNMIIDYVRQYNDPEYSLLVTGYESYFKKLQQLMNADTDTDSKRDVYQIEETKGKLFVQAQHMAADLNKLAQKILTDENKLLKKELYCIIDESVKQRLNITPERVSGIGT